METGKTNILKKMTAIMADVSFIKKDATNAHNKYDYASEFAIKRDVGAALREHGVIFQLDQDLPIQCGSVVIVPCRYTFWDAESGESLTGSCIGAGHTRDDKGVYAAITGAIKYCLTANFMVATGDDPETDKNHPPRDKTEGSGQYPEYEKVADMRSRVTALETRVLTNKEDRPLARIGACGKEELEDFTWKELRNYGIQLHAQGKEDGVE